jgi:predicted membrane-bound spermidine synthase
MGKTAGIINAADHLGAAFGAFISGAILLPVLGMNKSCFLLAAVSLLTAILLVFDLIQMNKVSWPKKQE